MRLIFIVLCAAIAGSTVSWPASAACRKGQCWGSVAFSRFTGYWVYSMNHPTEVAARSRAWLMCNQRCTNVVTVQNDCLALFVAPRGRFATAKGPTVEAATDAARQLCAGRNNDCVFRIARCTADFDELKRQALERARNKTHRRKAPPEEVPPAQVEELKL